MIAMMMVTFIMLFAFVVNTGMLVHAKINLQNAADLAAYAGASTQARQLNQISFLNYEMRRQYKKFLFRYYVIGNMAQESFPKAGGSGPAEWAPRSGGRSLGVPVVCIITNSNDNYCQNVNLAKIAVPDGSSIDNIQNAVNIQLSAIESLRQKNCVSIGQLGKITLRLWLFNTEPEGKDLSDALPAGADPEAQGMLNATKALTLGLGLVPREILLTLRAQTLASYLNQPGKANVTLEAAERLKREAPDQVKNERTVLAFFSAFNTLGEHSFPADGLSMDELLSGGGESSDLIELKPIRARFDTYFAEFQTDNPNSTAAQDCRIKVVPLTLPAPGIPVAIQKSLKHLTFYAVRLRAKARLLFNPFGDFELKAYSAAQPFGSRVGPIDDGAAERHLRQGASANQEFLFLNGSPGALAGNLPNLPVTEDDGPGGTGAGHGWDRKEVLAEMFNQLADPDGRVQQVDPDNLNRAYQAAMTPNPPEMGFFNIPSSLPDRFETVFDRDHAYRFYAPVLPLDERDKAPDRIREELQQLFAADDGRNTGNNQVNDLQVALLRKLTDYLAKLETDSGENGEGFKYAVIQDPYFDIPRGPASGQAKPIALSSRIQLPMKPENLKTSWSASADDNAAKAGRAGYSVKFIPFSLLLSKSVTTDGAGQKWENDLRLPDDAAADVARIKH